MGSLNVRQFVGLDCNHDGVDGVGAICSCTFGKRAPCAAKNNNDEEEESPTRLLLQRRKCQWIRTVGRSRSAAYEDGTLRGNDDDDDDDNDFERRRRGKK